MADFAKVSYPFGSRTKQNILAMAILLLSIENQLTEAIVSEMSEDIEVDIKPESGFDLQAGAMVIVAYTADATERTVSHAVGMLANDIVVAASKTVYAVYYYNGSQFILLSKNQIN